MSEHEFDRSHSRSSSSDADHDVTPNRSTRSAQLDAPTRPVASGIVMRKARDANGVAEGADAAVANASTSTGFALPETLMRKFEASLGADLSSVRVHTGGASGEAASAVGAKAYTMGQDIHFGAGHYDPSSAAGEHLLAHEVAHTVQQRGGSPTRQNKLEVSSPFDAAEHEADRAADAMIAGAHATIAGVQVSAARQIQREPEGEGAAEEQKAQINEKGTYDFEYELNEPFGNYVQLVGAAKGKVTVEIQNKTKGGEGQSAQVAVGPTASSKGVGVGAEISLSESVAKRSMFGVKFDDKGENKINFVLSSQKLEISVSHEGTMTFPQLPWLKPGAELKFIFAGVDWEKLQKHPDEIDVLAAEISVGLTGEGNMTIDNTIAKVGVQGSIGVKASPNWKKIAAEAGKRLAKEAAKEGAKEAAKEGAKQAVKEGAKEAAKEGAKDVAKEAAKDAAQAGTEAAAGAAETAITVDTAGVAASAAAVIIPAAVAALMIYGGAQAGDNRMVGEAATAYGAKAREQAHAYAKSYAQTIAGHQLGGPGAADAEAVLAKAMDGKWTREQASVAVLRNSGGYAAIESGIYNQTRDKLYASGVTAMEDRFRPNFGLIERIGETWGMRGVIRKDLHEVMYAD